MKHLLLVILIVIAMFSFWPRSCSKQIYEKVVSGKIRFEVKQVTLSKKSMDCLVLNAYHEARGETDTGMLAVTQVVLNRAKESKKSICEVVFKPHQFSWTSTKYSKVPKKSYIKIQKLINKLYTGDVTFPFSMKNVLYYHAKSVNPYWAASFKEVGIYRNHIFYREV